MTSDGFAELARENQLARVSEIEAEAISSSSAADEQARDQANQEKLGRQYIQEFRSFLVEAGVPPLPIYTTFRGLDNTIFHKTKWRGWPAYAPYHVDTSGDYGINVHGAAILPDGRVLNVDFHARHSTDKREGIFTPRFVGNILLVTWRDSFLSPSVINSRSELARVAGILAASQGVLGKGDWTRLKWQRS